VSEDQSTAVKAVLELYAALRDNRVPDVVALTTPDVVCEPLVRPGLSQYEGHQGMGDLARDMHKVHGDYQIEIIEVTEEPDQRSVTVRARIDPEPGHGEPLPVTSRYEVRDGLISLIESRPPD